MTTQSKSLRLADQLQRQSFAWPGGYPLYAITTDSAALCRDCCRRERTLIGTTTGSDGWCVTALAIHWEGELHCDHCGAEIDAAYQE